MPLIYAFVARDTTVLAEYTPFTGRCAPCSLQAIRGGARASELEDLCAHPAAGNFNTIALECLNKLNNPENKFTIACDGHTFNFLVHNGFSEFGAARQHEILHCLGPGHPPRMRLARHDDAKRNHAPCMQRTWWSRTTRMGGKFPSHFWRGYAMSLRRNLRTRAVLLQRTA
jgi:hypothetical protein